MSSRDAGKLAVAVVLAAGVVNASAQSPEDLERCRTIADPAARLACYDAAAAKAVPQRAPAPAPDATRPPGDAPDTAAELVPTGTLKGGQSLIAQRWELEERYNTGTFRFTFYRPNYILPVVYSSSVNDRPQTPTQPAPVLPGSLDEIEAEFQLSFKMKLWEDMLGSQSDLWLGYTQKSSWQVYNEELSRPFRETNYEPELIWTIPTNYEILGLKGRLLALGLVHQSNGRGDPLSRSWNKPWYRFSEDESKDDNPDIKDYIGSAEFLAFYKWQEQLITTLRLRTTFKSDPGWGSAQFDVRFPITSEFRGYLQIFSGYGESMIDYNFRKTSVGLGVSVGTWY
jgi:phospholipase A1